jgi:Rod binding domain-containing protein
MTGPIDPRLAQPFFHDLHAASSGEARAAQGAQDPTRAAKLKAAQEFEQVLLRQMLQGLQKASHVDQKGGILSSGGDMYGSMMVDALAQALSGGGGIGLADMLVRATDARPAPIGATGSPATAPGSGSLPTTTTTAVPSDPAPGDSKD